MGSNEEKRGGAVREISREIVRLKIFFRISSINYCFVTDRKGNSDDIREILPVQAARKTEMVLLNHFFVCGAVEKTVEDLDVRISLMRRAVVGGISRIILGSGCRYVSLDRK
jgi:hypothetical protein